LAHGSNEECRKLDKGLLVERLRKFEVASVIGELAALGAALSWVFSSVLYKKALFKASPLQANLIRLVSTSMFLLTVLIATKKIANLDLQFSVILTAGLSGVIGLVLGDILYMYSLKSVGVSKAVPLSCTYPLFNILIAVFLKGETVGFSIVLGAICIMAGTWMVSRQGNNRVEVSGGKFLVRGLAAALFTAVMWSVSISLMNVAVASPETSNIDGAFVVNAIRVFAASIVLFSACSISNRHLTFLKAPWKTWLILACGGVISLAIGWFFLTFSFLHIQESRAVPISSTTPLFSSIAGVTFLKEPVTSWVIIGSVFIVVGIFFLFI